MNGTHLGQIIMSLKIQLNEKRTSQMRLENKHKSSNSVYYM